MANSTNAKAASLVSVLVQRRETILSDWLRQMSVATRRADLIKAADLQGQCALFIELLTKALSSAGTDITSSAYDPIRGMLGDVSRSRALQGFSPSETATFVLSMKQPFFAAIRQDLARDPDALATELWNATELLDGLGLYTMEVYQKSREDVIRRQQEELLELSTPVVKLFEGILALPIIGTLDSARTQVVMESLLNAIVKTNSKIAIIDITGVPMVDTVVAQHLLKTVSAARLMGADCIISGVRPQIAQTIVHLGINLLEVNTKASLADAFTLAIRKVGLTAVSAEQNGTDKINTTTNPYRVSQVPRQL